MLPIPAHKHRVEQFVIDGQKVDATYLQGATVQLNVTGLAGVSMRFGTSGEGLPSNVQIVGAWQAESTILHVASLLESVSSTRVLPPRSENHCPPKRPSRLGRLSSFTSSLVSNPSHSRDGSLGDGHTDEFDRKEAEICGRREHLEV